MGAVISSNLGGMLEVTAARASSTGVTIKLSLLTSRRLHVKS